MPITDLFHWRSLTRSMEQIKPVPRMLQDLIFKQRITNPTDVIDIDLIIGGVRTCPFVSPVEGGTIISKLKQETRSVRPGRLRPKKPFGAYDLLTTRMPGQNLYVQGGGDITSAMAQRIALEQQDLRNTIDATVEWMCGQALTGSLTVSQDNISFGVDYKVPDTHKITLGSGHKWNEDSVDGQDILDDLQTWADLIGDAIGMAPDLVIMGRTAAKALRSKVKKEEWMDTTRALSGAGNLVWQVSNAYMGSLLGMNIYRYGGTVEHAGSDTNILGADKVSMICTQARISIEFGLIVDLEATVQAEYFSTSWEEKDPSVRWILSESDPLPVLWQPECLVYADVL